MLSRTHPNLVKKLFALEVPEIADGTVEIVAIAREAGHRTKIAVKSNVPGVNAKGSCIGPMGQRVRNVMNELHGEKIDIVDWSDDPARDGRRTRSSRPGSRSVEVVDLARPLGPGGRARLPAVARDRQGGPERPARRAADRVADRHPLRRGRRAAGPDPVSDRVTPVRISGRRLDSSAVVTDRRDLHRLDPDLSAPASVAGASRQE